MEVGRAGGPAEVNTGYAIIRLDKISPINEDAFMKEKAEFSKKLIAEKRNEAFSTWFSKLKQKANLRENI
ncbi:MAG: hypothetical protein ABIB11_01695 [Candidatus Omnitrophota bacterium]